MVKKLACINIDDRILNITRKLNINRSKVATEALKIAIKARLNTITNDISELEKLAMEHGAECQKVSQELELIGQRYEQQEYAIRREKEAWEETGQKVVHEFKNFCISQNINERLFIKFLLEDNWDISFEREERLLIVHLQDHGLPSDLNVLRERLTKQKVPVVVSR